MYKITIVPLGGYKNLSSYWQWSQY